MNKPHISNADELKSAIRELERKKETEEQEVKVQFQHTLHALKPVNLLKSTAKSFVRDDHWRSKMVTSAVGFGLGFLAKKTIVGKSASLGKKILGAVLKFGLKKAQANKNKIEDKASDLLKRIT
jgi:ElaB/YqjD/DUF883 family membrane-anchored ribosome-binding protein